MTVQKYLRGYRVKVQDAMPKHMAHFPAGFEAIIIGSHSDLFLTGLPEDYRDYQLLRLEDGRPVNIHAWYGEDQLTLLSDDRAAGEALLSAYIRRCAIAGADPTRIMQDDVVPSDTDGTPRP